MPSGLALSASKKIKEVDLQPCLEWIGLDSPLIFKKDLTINKPFSSIWCTNVVDLKFIFFFSLVKMHLLC